jgi:hypothetical protein
MPKCSIVLYHPDPSSSISVLCVCYHVVLLNLKSYHGGGKVDMIS